jgi:cytochrome c-type biogenesis protein
MENVNLLVALGAGLVSFLSPCILPMVPVYLSALAGPEFLDPGKVQTLNRPVFFFHALAFVLGFSLIFTALGAIAGLTGSFISSDSAVVRYVTGSILVLFGAYMLAAARFPGLNFEKRINVRVGRGGYLRSFMTGAVFTFAWTPCVSPILGSILTMAVTGDTMWQSSGLLLVYSLGLGIPFLAIGLAMGSALPLLRRMSRYTIWFYIIGGVALVTVGFLILMGKLNVLAV